MSLTPNDRIHLKTYLTDRFNVDELKDLTFALGMSHESFPHATISEFARELIFRCERECVLSCLVQLVIEKRPNSSIAELLTRLGLCNPHVKVILIIDAAGFDEDVKSLKQKLADLIEVSLEEVELIAAKRGSVQILIGISKDAAEKLLTKSKNLTVDGRVKILAIVQFSNNLLDEQANWKSIAVTQGFNRSFSELNSSSITRPQNSTSSTKIYVGNLSYDTTENTLHSLFSQAGIVSEVAIVVDRSTNRSRGFAFVTMASDKDAQRAIDMLDGKAVDGHTIKLDVASSSPRNRGGSQGGNRGSDRNIHGGHFNS